MAHFTKVNDDGSVGETIVVANDVLLDENGEENEALGLELIHSLGFDGLWVQSSYNGNFRGRFPGRGFTYDAVLDCFIPPKPYESWLLDEATCLWQAPIECPADGGTYTWDETAGDWVEVTDEAS